MKYCRNCGSPVEDGDAFCGYCGSKLANAEEQKQAVKNEFVDEQSSDVGHTDGYARGDFRPEKDFTSDVEQEFSTNGEKEYDVVDEKRGTSTTFVAGQNKRKPLKRNQIAESANTFGILALIFGILGGILGIVFGVVGLCKAKQAKDLCDTGEYDGKPKVSNARILSTVGLIIAAIWIITLIF